MFYLVSFALYFRDIFASLFKIVPKFCQPGCQPVVDNTKLFLAKKFN